MKCSRRGVSEEGIDMAVRNWGVLFRLSSCSRHEYFSSLLPCQHGPDAGHHPPVASRPIFHNADNSTADEQDNLPEVNKRLYLRFRLPPVLGRRLCALVRKTSQLQLLLGQVEVSARDLQEALAVCPGQHEKLWAQEATHMDLVRLHLVTGRHRWGVFSIDHDANTMLHTYPPGERILAQGSEASIKT